MGRTVTTSKHTDPAARVPDVAAGDPVASRLGVRARVNQALERTPIAAAYSTVAGALVVIVIGVVTVLPHPTAAGFVGLAVVAVCLAALYRSVTAERFAPAAVTFWGFVLVWVGVPPLLQIRDGRLPWPDSPLTHLFLTAEIILLVAVLVFWWGYFGRPGRPRTDRPLPPPEKRFQVTVPYAAVITAGTALLAGIAIPMTGGLGVRFHNRDAVAEALAKAGLTGGSDQALSGLVNLLPAAASISALILCLRCIKAKAATDKRSRVVLYCATAVAAGLNLIFNNPLSASRFISLSTLLAAALVLIDFTPLWRRIAFALTIVGGLAIVYPLADALRNDLQRSSLRIGTDAYYTYDFDGFQQTVNSVYYMGVHGPTYGHHILSALLFWVPRSLWIGKAMPAGFPVAASRGYQFQNLSMPLWAELFVEFWFFGLALMYVYGRIVRRIDQWQRADSASLGGAVAIIFVAAQIGLIRGPLGSQVPFLATALLVALSGLIVQRLLRYLQVRLRRRRSTV
jgi:hypothetical protein